MNLLLKIITFFKDHVQSLKNALSTSLTQLLSFLVLVFQRIAMTCWVSLTKFSLKHKTTELKAQNIREMRL